MLSLIAFVPLPAKCLQYEVMESVWDYGFDHTPEWGFDKYWNLYAWGDYLTAGASISASKLSLWFESTEGWWDHYCGAGASQGMSPWSGSPPDFMAVANGYGYRTLLWTKEGIMFEWDAECVDIDDMTPIGTAKAFNILIDVWIYFEEGWDAGAGYDTTHWLELSLFLMRRLYMPPFGWFNSEIGAYGQQYRTEPDVEEPWWQFYIVVDDIHPGERSSGAESFGEFDDRMYSQCGIPSNLLGQFYGYLFCIEGFGVFGWAKFYSANIWTICLENRKADMPPPDRVIDIADLVTVQIHFGAKYGQPNYFWATDINKDEVIDIEDVTLVAMYYGTHY